MAAKGWNNASQEEDTESGSAAQEDGQEGLTGAAEVTVCNWQTRTTQEDTDHVLLTDNPGH